MHLHSSWPLFDRRLGIFASHTTPQIPYSHWQTITAAKQRELGSWYGTSIWFQFCQSLAVDARAQCGQILCSDASYSGDGMQTAALADCERLRTNMRHA